MVEKGLNFLFLFFSAAILENGFKLRVPTMESIKLENVHLIVPIIVSNFIFFPQPY